MSGAAHTPGPWIASKDPNAISPDDWCVGTGPQNIDNVAGCSFCDAHLIAAAPELLDVVKGFRRKLETYVSVYPGDKELRRLLSNCDAAIAKATEAQP